jgi:hypothetical protein
MGDTKNRHGRKTTENTEEIYLKTSKFRVIRELFSVAVNLYFGCGYAAPRISWEKDCRHLRKSGD